MKRFWAELTGQQRTATLLAMVAVTMLSLAYASVPFYDWFCRVTGYGGTTSVATTGSDVILDQTIKIRFDASVDSGMPWSFKPQQTVMELRIGETGLAYYEAHNPTDRPIAGQAAYNVSPNQAGAYFDKIECFCFTEQVLQPGETVLMPVSFFVDPAILDDPEAKFIHTITLSYTFYQIDLPEAQEQAALTNQASDAIDIN